MAPLYKLVTAELGVPVDEALLAKLSEANSEQVKKLTDALESAKTNAGETEVKDAILAHGDYFASIGDKDKATEWYEKAFEKSVGAGTKLDVIFSIIRVGFFWHEKTVMLLIIIMLHAILFIAAFVYLVINYCQPCNSIGPIVLNLNVLCAAVSLSFLLSHSIPNPQFPIPNS